MIVCRLCLVDDGSCPDMLPEERVDRDDVGRGRACFHPFATLADFRAHVARHGDG